MAKIRITQPTEDKETKEKYNVGRVLDLGAVRNKRAVDTNQAVWVGSEKLEKELSKNPQEGQISMTEKVDVPHGAKKTFISGRNRKQNK